MKVKRGGAGGQAVFAARALRAALSGACSEQVQSRHSLTLAAVGVIRIARMQWSVESGEGGGEGEKLPKSAAAVSRVNHVKRERDKILEKERIHGSNH